MYFVNKSGTVASYLRCPEVDCTEEYRHGLDLCEKRSRGEKCYIFDEWGTISWKGPINWNSTNSFSLKYKSNLPKTSYEKALCRKALNSTTGLWENNPTWKEEVVEAKKKGLTEQRCSELVNLKISKKKTKGLTGTLSSIEQKCETLGFKRGTKKFGDCVMELYK